ncbi:hypothetical protein HNY73_017142 [Argiope bruennichi]|uniref:Uncharacterized protein n=1 Tax=Argiope bruennichi TaxID=94029 RepID=A0A8T0EKW7_ARGBR|nr:hypothetical protein HNY73_017142 [Argiope bruennichi]
MDELVENESFTMEMDKKPVPAHNTAKKNEAQGQTPDQGNNSAANKLEAARKKLESSKHLKKSNTLAAKRKVGKRLKPSVNGARMLKVARSKTPIKKMAVTTKDKKPRKFFKEAGVKQITMTATKALRNKQ